MTTTKFDPVEGNNYSVCSTCGETFATEPLSDEHLRLTGPRTNPGVSRSHSVSIKNPSRENRIRNWLENIVDEAVREATDQFWDLVNADHVTAEEVTKALAFHREFGDAWREEQSRTAAFSSPLLSGLSRWWLWRLRPRGRQRLGARRCGARTATRRCRGFVLRVT